VFKKGAKKQAKFNFFKKIMKRNIAYFLLGFFVASILATIYSFFLLNDNRNGSTYFILNKDYQLGENGMLKKGTKIKFDKGMDEGFDRFILYLNLKGGDVTKIKEQSQFIPYWLNDSIGITKKSGSNK
jgi:hypothetical protein